MNIPSTTSPSAATSAAATAATSAGAPAAGALSGSKDEFLKLFMAQLEHQDPLNPQDGADLVAQLAQFSTVEQATQTNQHLAELASAQASASSASLSNLLGRDCTAAAADFTFDRKGQVPPIQVSSSSAMNGATLVIKDDAGTEVRRIAIPAGAKSAQLAWDGNNAAGAPAAAGNYHISIDPGTSTGAISTQWRGRVDAVELSGGAAQLRIGGVLLVPADIQSIGLTVPTTTTTTTTP
jgi:flagellar basal-body rod modification protein FlgD